MKCSICTNQIKPDANGWDKGHNAWPINDEKCCGECNDSVVVPIRLAQFFNNKKTNKGDSDGK